MACALSLSPETLPNLQGGAVHPRDVLPSHWVSTTPATKQSSRSEFHAGFVTVRIAANGPPPPPRWNGTLWSIPTAAIVRPTALAKADYCREARQPAARAASAEQNHRSPFALLISVFS